MTVLLDAPARGAAAIPVAVSAGGGHHSREVDFILVHERLAPMLDAAAHLGDIPVLGSPAWADLALTDVRWRHSVVAAGYRWAMREWLEQDASIALAQSLSASEDWSQLASTTQQYNAFRVANPWAQRRKATA